MHKFEHSRERLVIQVICTRKRYNWKERATCENRNVNKLLNIDALRYYRERLVIQVICTRKRYNWKERATYENCNVNKFEH